MSGKAPDSMVCSTVPCVLTPGRTSSTTLFRSDMWRAERTSPGLASPKTIRVKGWRFAEQRVEIEVDAEAATLVVVAQTYYHRWRAHVDGKPAPLLRANYAFQAVEVPAGNHQIRLAYEDRAFQIGALISGISWLVCAAGCVWRKRL